MAFYYFAWKNGIKADNRDLQEWDELSQKQYLQICANNKEVDLEDRRFFEKVSGIEQGDDTYYFECDYQGFLQAEAKAKVQKRKRDELKELKESGKMPELVSLDAEYFDESGESYTLHDLVADENSLFEDSLIQSIDLQNALASLSNDEKKIVDAIYFSSKPTTEKELAEQTGVPRTTLQSQKYKILKKLKKSFGIY